MIGFLIFLTYQKIKQLIKTGIGIWKDTLLTIIFFNLLKKIQLVLLELGL